MVLYNYRREQKKGRKKMAIITIILGITLFIIGFGLIDYNMENDAKHNIIIGFVVLVLLLLVLC